MKSNSITKTILITGAGSGIGLSSTKLFAGNGYRVFATFRKKEDSEILSRISNVIPIKMDVNSQTDIEAAYSLIKQEVGSSGLYALINNAGIVYTMPFEHMSIDTAKKVMDTNFWAPIILSKTFIPLLKKFSDSNNVKARIINIASWTAYLTLPFLSLYSASKASIYALTEGMHYDLGLLGIHAIVASPGATKTPILDKGANYGKIMSKIPKPSEPIYERYIKNYCDAGENFKKNKFFYTPEMIAKKILAIAETRNPKAKYNMAPDAKIIGGFFTKFVPFLERCSTNENI